jgi:hypothetical protein
MKTFFAIDEIDIIDRNLRRSRKRIYRKGVGIDEIEIDKEKKDQDDKEINEF